MRLEEAASRRKEVEGKVGSRFKTERLLVLQPTHMLSLHELRSMPHLPVGGGPLAKNGSLSF